MLEISRYLNWRKAKMLKAGLCGYQIWYHAIAYAEELQKSKSVRMISVFDENLQQALRLGETPNII